MAASPPTQSPENNTPEQPWCQRAFLAACVALFVGGLVLFIVGKVNEADTPDMENLPSKEDVYAWSTEGQSGGGLSLLVMNSLEDRWTPIFDEYIQRWDSGQPDALTLTTRKYDHNPECEFSYRRVNVCNGNYGNTYWVGIAHFFAQDGYVVSTVCRLNDYHLDGRYETMKQYVMCHELGHAFGLPHTDTNFDNSDRGDCLDYTANPQNNLDPGQHNFNLLYEVYGSANGDKITPAHTGNGNRKLEATTGTEIPGTILEKFSNVVACLETMTCSECLDAAIVDGNIRKRVLCSVKLGMEFLT